jgi:hypothetical protein
MPEALWGGALATGYSAMTRDGERRPSPSSTPAGSAPPPGSHPTPGTWPVSPPGSSASGATEEVLRAHTLQEMQRVHYVDPSFETYWGLGFGVYRAGGTTFVGHGGSCPGYRTQLLLQMDDRMATIFMANAGGVNTVRYAQGMHAVMAPALKEAVQEREKATKEATLASSSPASRPPSATGRGAAAPAAEPELNRYLGTYDALPWSGETAVVRWKGGLALLSLPADDPVRALTRLEHVEGHTFRRIRENDDTGRAHPLRGRPGRPGHGADPVREPVPAHPLTRRR